MNRRNAGGTTISDVAARAGVSTATVSLALNGGKDVSATTRARVIEIAAAMGFRPNRVARSLRTGTSSVVALLVPDLGNPFYGELAKGVVAATSRLGLHVVITQTARETADEELDALLDHQCDGFIFTSLVADDLARLHRLHAASIPFVQLLRECPGINGDFVAADDRRGGMAAASHLLALGHERIAIVAGLKESSASRTRLAGMRRALSRGGHPLDPRLLVHADLTRDGAYGDTAELLQAPIRPTAILCGNDAMALGVWDALHDAGLRVPADISIVGYDDMAFASARAVGLTTVAQPRLALGEQAVRVLQERRARPESPPQRVILPSRFIARTSTAPPAAPGGSHVHTRRPATPRPASNTAQQGEQRP